MNVKDDESLMLPIITYNSKTYLFKQNFADSSICAAFLPREKQSRKNLTLIVIPAVYTTL